MLKVEVKIDDLDYEKIIKSKMPGILQELSKQDDKMSKLAHILIGLEDLPINMINAALGVLSKQEKEDLMVKIFTEYKDEIVNFINSKAHKNSISAEFIEINITTIN